MKKGYVYTISILLLLGVLLALHTAQTNNQQPIANNQLRMIAMNDFLSDLEQDLERATFIAGFRSFLAIEEHLIDTTAYLDSLEDTFFEAITKGTIQEQEYEILNNSALKDYFLRINYTASQQGLIINLTTNNLVLSQVNPWSVRVTHEPTIYLLDARAGIEWNLTTTTTTNIPISNLQDPLYIIETNNRAPNEITRQEPPYYVHPTTNDTTNLEETMINSYYAASEQAPSFLQRYEGNNTPHEQGIQSLINPELLSAQGITIYDDRSLVDHLYFFEPGSADWCDIQGLPVYFKIDDDNKVFYDLEGLDASPC